MAVYLTRRKMDVVFCLMFVISKSPTKTTFTASHMHLGDPALHTQLEILCSDLTSLCRVHSSLRDVAERVLYSHIYLRAYPFDLIEDKRWKSWALSEKRSLLHTLNKNARKAEIVTSLYIELKQIQSYALERAMAIRSILVKVSEALQNMPNLVDLRIDENEFDEGDIL